uniref:Non-haem dioxygenase N-terminal domain-containing protein n=1 Tax=Aegilops tauschii TaxID=37682 RepID=M8AX80_AEGTA
MAAGEGKGSPELQPPAMPSSELVFFVVAMEVTNHGIESSLMDDVITAAKAFFHQPLEEKQKCSNLLDGQYLRENL